MLHVRLAKSDALQCSVGLWAKPHGLDLTFIVVSLAVLELLYAKVALSLSDWGGTLDFSVVPWLRFSSKP